MLAPLRLSHLSVEVELAQLHPSHKHGDQLGVKPMIVESNLRMF